MGSVINYLESLVNTYVIKYDTTYVDICDIIKHNNHRSLVFGIVLFKLMRLNDIKIENDSMVINTVVNLLPDNTIEYQVKFLFSYHYAITIGLKGTKMGTVERVILVYYKDKSVGDIKLFLNSYYYYEICYK